MYSLNLLFVTKSSGESKSRTLRESCNYCYKLSTLGFIESSDKNFTNLYLWHFYKPDSSTARPEGSPLFSQSRTFAKWVFFTSSTFIWFIPWVFLSLYTLSAVPFPSPSLLLVGGRGMEDLLLVRCSLLWRRNVHLIVRWRSYISDT